MEVNTDTYPGGDGRHVIESNKVEGTRVVDPLGKRLGRIDHLLIEKVSGRAVYAVMTFGGFMGLRRHTHMIPWDKLHYDKGRHGYCVILTAAELNEAPVILGDGDLFPDRSREKELHDYWNVPPYWGI